MRARGERGEHLRQPRTYANQPGVYTCTAGRIGHRSHPLRVTYANKHERRPALPRDRLTVRFRVCHRRSDKLQRHYCQFVYTPADSRQHEAGTHTLGEARLEEIPRVIRGSMALPFTCRLACRSKILFSVFDRIDKFPTRSENYASHRRDFHCGNFFLRLIVRGAYFSPGV